MLLKPGVSLHSFSSLMLQELSSQLGEGLAFAKRINMFQTNLGVPLRGGCILPFPLGRHHRQLHFAAVFCGVAIAKE
jgi:hypothetical protein